MLFIKLVLLSFVCDSVSVEDRAKETHNNRIKKIHIEIPEAKARGRKQVSKRLKVRKIRNTRERRVRRARVNR